MLLLNFVAFVTNDLLRGKVQLKMPNGSKPTIDNRRVQPTLGERVREWVDELVEGVVDLMSPPAVPVPVRRRQR